MWQARNIAEHAYCPRLFHFMQVEGVFLPSTDTEQGVSVHRRVDKPAKAANPPAEGRGEPEEDSAKPRAVRSLTLFSEALQLTAKLDLAEITGATAIPVEYRKGRPKRAALAPPPEGFGQSWQYSVFFCCLREIDRVRMQTALEAELNLKEDQCLILDLGGDEAVAREAAVTLGEALPDRRGTMTVI
jgi:CRISPR-associated protein Cas2